MGNSIVKMLALDLDGTLTNAEKQITPAVRKSITQVVSKGVYVVLASGRPIPGMAHVADDLELHKTGGYVLSNNGSKIVEWKTKAVVFESTIPHQAVVAACRAAHEYGVDALVYDEYGLFSENPDARYVEKERFNNSAHATKVRDLLKTITWEPNKMMVVGEPEELKPVLMYLENELAGVANVFLSEPYFIEITPLGIKKDAAILLLAKKLNIELANVMACGDGLNDIPMLQVAGIAVAMENAYDETKQHADWIAPSNEDDGVAAAVEKFILGA